MVAEAISIPFFSKKEKERKEKKAQVNYHAFAEQSPFLFLLHTLVRGNFASKYLEPIKLALQTTDQLEQFNPIEFMQHSTTYEFIAGMRNSSHAKSHETVDFEKAQEMSGIRSEKLQAELQLAAEEAHSYAYKLMTADPLMPILRNEVASYRRQILPADFTEVVAPLADPASEAYKRVRDQYAPTLDERQFQALVDKRSHLYEHKIHQAVQQLTWQLEQDNRISRKKKSKELQVNNYALAQIERALLVYRCNSLTEILQKYVTSVEPVKIICNANFGTYDTHLFDNFSNAKILDRINASLPLQYVISADESGYHHLSMYTYGTRVDRIEMGSQPLYLSGEKGICNYHIHAALGSYRYAKNRLESHVMSRKEAQELCEEGLRDCFIQKCLDKTYAIRSLQLLSKKERVIKKRVHQLAEIIETYGIDRNDFFTQEQGTIQRILDLLVIKYADSIPQERIYNSIHPKKGTKEYVSEKIEKLKQYKRHVALLATIGSAALFLAGQSDITSYALKLVEEMPFLADMRSAEEAAPELVAHEVRSKRILARIDAFNDATIPEYIISGLSNTLDAEHGKWKLNDVETPFVLPEELPLGDLSGKYLMVTDHVYTDDGGFVVAIPQGHRLAAARLEYENGKPFNGYILKTNSSGMVSVVITDPGLFSSKLLFKGFFLPDEVGPHAITDIAPINKDLLSPEAQSILEQSSSVQDIADYVSSQENHLYSVTTSIPQETTREKVVNEIEEDPTANCLNAATEVGVLSAALDDKVKTNIASGFLVKPRKNAVLIPANAGHAFVLTSDGKVIDGTPSVGKVIDEETKQYLKEKEEIENKSIEELQLQWEQDEEKAVSHTVSSRMLTLLASVSAAFVTAGIAFKKYGQPQETDTFLLESLSTKDESSDRGHGKNNFEQKSKREYTAFFDELFVLRDEWMKRLKEVDKGDKRRLMPMITRFTADIFSGATLAGPNVSYEEKIQILQQIETKLDYWKQEWENVQRAETEAGFKEGLELRGVRDLLKSYFAKGEALTLEPEEQAARAKTREVDMLRKKYQKVLGPYARLYPEAQQIIRELSSYL